MATSRLILYLQSLRFKLEHTALLHGRPVPKSSKIVAPDPFINAEGILRVGGRLWNSMVSVNVKYPILLPYHSVSKLLMHQCHLNTLHGGNLLTLRSLRERYWIINGRSLVRMVIRNCVICARAKPRSLSQFMQDLTIGRCPLSRAFFYVGVDYAGPCNVRDSAGKGRTTHKTYIAVFVCFSTRAIHIELVHDYSSNTFLAALDRFLSQRGLPTKIFNDNEKNFVGADREFKVNVKRVLYSDELQTRCANLAIHWHFNPLLAPHFSGLQEAGVKSLKHHLRRILGAFAPTVEEMSTLLCKAKPCSIHGHWHP